MSLIINEIHADPDPLGGDANQDGVTDASQDEFVEIVNSGPGTEDLSNYTLTDGSAVRHVFSPGTTLAPGESIVVFGGGSISFLTLPAGSSAVIASSGALGLNNAADTVTLADASMVTVATYFYGSEGGDNQSITRDPDLTGGFVKHSLATGSGGSLYSPGTQIDGTAFCFAAGTRIATPDGEHAVETLRIGDPVLTSDGRCVPVLWIGRQTVSTVLAGPGMEPVRIRAGALGDGLPRGDLTVTADHGMILDGLVINASALVNGTTIRWVPLSELPERVTWYHVETEAHDVILANGAEAETFVDFAGRQAFDNYAEYVSLYGADRLIAERAGARISSRRHVPETIRARLDGMAPIELEQEDALRA